MTGAYRGQGAGAGEQQGADVDVHQDDDQESTVHVTVSVAEEQDETRELLDGDVLVEIINGDGAENDIVPRWRRIFKRRCHRFVIFLASRANNRLCTVQCLFSFILYNSIGMY